MLSDEIVAHIWRNHADCNWVSTGINVEWSCGIIHPGPIHMQPATRDRHVAALVMTQVEADRAAQRAEGAETALREAAINAVPKWVNDQHRAQIARLQETIQKYQQKENDHASEPEQRPDSVDSEKSTLDPADEDPAADPTPADRPVPEGDATEVRPADRVHTAATGLNIRGLAEAVSNASYKIGWDGLTRQQQATECLRAEVVLRTTWFADQLSDAARGAQC